MTDTANQDDDTSADDALKRRLLNRIAIAAVVVVGLLGSLAMFDALNSPPKPALPPVAVLPPAAETPAPVPSVPEPAPAAAPVVPPEPPVPPVSEAAPASTAPTAPAAPATPAAAAAAASRPTPPVGPAPLQPPRAVPSPTLREPREVPAWGPPPAVVNAGPPPLVKGSPAPVPAPPPAPLPPLPDEKPLTKPATSRPASIRPSEPLPAVVLAPDRTESGRELAQLPSASKRAPASRPLSREVERQFALQMGVFSSVVNAEDMRAKLELHGIPASIEARVHVGPFATREEADRARLRLRELGLEGGLLVTLKK